MNSTERDNDAACSVCFCSKPFRRLFFLALVGTVLVNTLDVFQEERQFRHLDTSESQQGFRVFFQNSIIPSATQWQSHPHVMFLDPQGTGAFSLDGVVTPSSAVKRERVVDDIWNGSREPNHKSYQTMDVLYNPVTLSGKEGKDVCRVAADWQARFYPTCNAFHEMVFHPGGHDLKHKKGLPNHVTDGIFMEYLGSGKTRDAFKVHKETEAVVLKTLKVDHEFSPEVYHHQRVDAVASERLSGSPYVINIFGFCGLSVMNELGVEYDEHESLTTKKKLHYARDIAAGMSHMHSIDGADNAMVVHADIRRGNVMFTMDRSVLKLSDFNRGFYLGWNKQEKEPCAVQRPYIKRDARRDKFSAPEETYRQVLTEKSDVYHLGGMLFYILTGKRPYSFNKKSQLTKTGNPLVTDTWVMPAFPETIQKSKDPAIVAMKKAVRACLRYEKEDRASAKEIYIMLNDAIESIAKQHR